MKPTKKNNFFTFIFSFLPGAAEMYMGFMKNGFSILAIFFIALGSGIITMFTPCVFPMIPMTVNFFMHSSGDKRKNRRQAWFFGFSIIFIFAVIGAILGAEVGEGIYPDVNQDSEVNIADINAVIAAILGL